MTRASLGDTGLAPAGANAANSAANQACSSGRPAAGVLVTAVSAREARTIACRTSRSGRSSAAGYPECMPIVSTVIDRCVDGSAPMRAGGAPNAAVCHP